MTLPAAPELDPERDPWPPELSESSRKLLSAATAAFSENGYHATKTRDIASRAGMSPAALYVHFPSKAALLGQISRVGHAAAVALIETAIATRPDPESRLREATAQLTAWHAEHHAVARIVQYELADVPEPDRRAVIDDRRRIQLLIGEQIAAGLASGVFTVADSPRRLTRAIISLSVDVARWYTPGGADTPDAIGAFYADLAARMVGAARND